MNLLGFLGNRSVDRVDRLGLTPQQGHCGPDVTQAVINTLEKIEKYFANEMRVRGSQRSACEALYMAGLAQGAWEISELFGIENRPPDPEAGNTGCCRNTVVYKGQCVHAGALNYIAFGKMNWVCRKRFSLRPFVTHVELEWWQSGALGLAGEAIAAVAPFPVPLPAVLQLVPEVYPVTWSRTDVWLAVAHRQFGQLYDFDESALQSFYFADAGYGEGAQGGSAPYMTCGRHKSDDHDMGSVKACDMGRSRPYERGIMRVHFGEETF